MHIGSIKKKQKVGIILLNLCWEYFSYKRFIFFLFPYFIVTKPKIEMKYKIKNTVLILPSSRVISSMTPAIGRRKT